MLYYTFQKTSYRLKNLVVREYVLQKYLSMPKAGAVITPNRQHYLLWRVLTGRQESTELSLILVGHTKFSSDHHFGDKEMSQFYAFFRESLQSKLHERTLTQNENTN